MNSFDLGWPPLTLERQPAKYRCGIHEFYLVFHVSTNIISKNNDVRKKIREWNVSVYIFRLT